jgi:hypothetical protein
VVIFSNTVINLRPPWKGIFDYLNDHQLQMKEESVNSEMLSYLTENFVITDPELRV